MITDLRYYDHAGAILHRRRVVGEKAVAAILVELKRIGTRKSGFVIRNKGYSRVECWYSPTVEGTMRRQWALIIE
jgi:hypothetical protein